MNTDEARNCINEIFRGNAPAACLVPLPHCRQRMQERQVTMDDLFHVLLSGQVVPGSNPGDADDLIFRVEGKDLEGEPLKAVVKIDLSAPILYCLSVF